MYLLRAFRSRIPTCHIIEQSWHNPADRDRQKIPEKYLRLNNSGECSNFSMQVVRFRQTPTSTKLVQLFPIISIVRKLGGRNNQQHWQGFTGLHILNRKLPRIHLMLGDPPLTSELRSSLKNNLTTFCRERSLQTQRCCLWALAIALLFPFFGCGKSDAPSQTDTTATPAAKQEQLAKQAFSIQDEAFDLLTNIRDQQTAEAAIAGMENIRKQVESLIAEAKKSGALTPEVKNRIMAEVEKNKKEITDKVIEFSKRLATNPQLLQSLQPVLQKLDELRRQYDGFIN